MSNPLEHIARHVASGSVHVAPINPGRVVKPVYDSEEPVFVEEGSKEAKAAHKVVYVKQKLNFHDHLQSLLGEIENSIDNPKNNEKFQAALEAARDGLLGVRAFY
jgi:hypothetical protein